MNKKDTSWEEVEGWYSSAVGEKGHYYHRTLILPSSLRLLRIQKEKPLSVLDIGCGQGVFARCLPPSTIYCGIDASPSLIEEAKKQTRHSSFKFYHADATQPFPVEKKDFDCAIFILSLQNMEHQDAAIANARKHLKKGGHLLLVLNHPCFRIPRQSSWGIDEASKQQYRRIQRYMSSMKIPIQMNPGKKEQSAQTFSFHHSMSDTIGFLSKASFSLVGLEEWCSDKKSEGGRAKMEDRARSEIPLFLALLARAE
jgi:ubiquinone/menaquinone biosynthesis C-methylase UbiE